MSGRRFFTRSRSVDFSEHRKRTTHAHETACERIVASAAPRTPMPNTNMNSGSSTMLSADRHGEHARCGKALRSDEGVEPERELHEDRAETVDRDIFERVGERRVARAEETEDRHGEKLHDERERERDRAEREGTRADDALRTVRGSLSHEHGNARRAAHAHERGECRDDHDRRHRHADAGERRRAVDRDVADVDAVYNII